MTIAVVQPGHSTKSQMLMLQLVLANDYCYCTTTTLHYVSVVILATGSRQMAIAVVQPRYCTMFSVINVTTGSSK